MALAYGDFHELSHQLRFLLFEIGIGLPQSAINHFITRAHRDCLQRLQQAALKEQLIHATIASHHAHDFLDLLQHKIKPVQPASVFYQWQSLRREVDESIANEALAIAYRQTWSADLKQAAKGQTSFWVWLNEHYGSQELLEFLEQWGSIGHPNHPVFRSKIGFNRREVIQYSPEFNARVAIHWGALRRDRANIIQGRTQYLPLLANQFPQEYLRWSERLTFNQLNPADYIPVPIHPWQWRNQVKDLFAQLIDHKELIFMPHFQMTKPSMSFRTMMPQGKNACHLKLATAIHTTSALRTVSPASVHNGPPVTDWLSGLLAQQDYYHQSLFLAGDLAGLNVNHPAIPSHHKNQLALLIRANPIQFITANQRLVPLASLFSHSPISGCYLLTEIINSSNLSPLQYFRNYCQCVLAGQLHLLLCYGVALESHQQNTLVTFADHRPVALVIRDLGGIRICTHPFFDDVPKPVFHPESSINTDSLEEICNKFIHGNLLSNLACWISSLSIHYKIPEKSLWQIVHQQIKTGLDNCKGKINSHILYYFQQQLLTHSWQHKSLLSMRLNQGNPSDIYTTISNPLSELNE